MRFGEGGGVFTVGERGYIVQWPIVRFSIPFLLAAAAQGGVLVSQNAKGFQFVEAAAITVDGKDKVLNAGPEPRLEGPVGKLPSVKLDGSLMKDKNTGALVLSTDGSITYVLPEGAAKNPPASLGAAWANPAIAYKKSKADKDPGEIPASEFIAFLPGDLSELVSLCMNRRMMALIGGSGKAFATELDFIAAVVKAFPADPAVAPLQKYVARSMRERFDQFEGGTATVEVLDQALKLADLSAAIYPNAPEQAKLRDQISSTKVWLDRKVAVLRAFAAGDEWDQYILGDRDFDRYSPAFPDLMSLRATALQASLGFHRGKGEEYLASHEFEAAYREFRLASLRQPSDKLLQQRVLMTWADYSREVALDNQRNRKQLGTGEREILNQAIQFASNYKSENKLELALKSIQDAEALDPDSLPMLLKKAEILGAQRSFNQALHALDSYDLHAVDEEREKSSTLRNELLFKQKSSLEDIKDQIRKAWADGGYHKLHELALEGLQAKDDDGELLYQAAIASLITREPKRAQTFLTRYLEVTNTLDADSEQRARVRSVLANIRDTQQTETGERNWLSGKKLPSNIFYCPISLAFQPRVERIEASNKMRVSYQWNGGQLVSITPTFEKAAHATGEERISFVYNDAFPQVLIAADGDSRASKPDTPDPDELLKRSSLIVLNNPYIDPDAVEKLTGKTVALGISGNRFFEPFVWDKIHYFRLKYDSDGRVSGARELSESKAGGGDLTLEFDWDGLQLTAIRGYQGADPKHRSQIYERTMHYEEDRLVAEDIQSGGKSSRIKYNYNGGRLVSANCSTDSTLDDRSRQVSFR